ncbi:hypothetical protein FHR94_000697 [Halomonas cerina]|uniref:Uncharacterized protein n=1 Tax=Halomonas cerina TaxID=447424 RepID=A0A839V144_9GAMM|nr:hypothetical protein [Halomonas cerina]
MPCADTTRLPGSDSTYRMTERRTFVPVPATTQNAPVSSRITGADSRRVNGQALASMATAWPPRLIAA